MTKLPTEYIVHCTTSEQISEVLNYVNEVELVDFLKLKKDISIRTKNGRQVGWAINNNYYKDNPSYSGIPNYTFEQWEKLTKKSIWKIGDHFNASGILYIIESKINDNYCNLRNLTTKENIQISIISLDHYIGSGDWKLINKQQEEMKQEFTVGGTKILKDAFMQQLEMEGIKPNDIATKQMALKEPFYIHCGTYNKDNSYGYVGGKCDVHYTLPEDWDKAIQAFKDYHKDGFKVGDWVITNKEGKSYEHHPEIGFTFKIQKISGNSLYFEEGKCVGNERVRKATEEEIKKAQKPKSVKTNILSDSGTFTVDVFKDKVVVENQEIPISHLSEIVNFRLNKHAGYYQVSVSKVNIGCKVGISFEQIKAVIGVANSL